MPKRSTDRIDHPRHRDNDIVRLYRRGLVGTKTHFGRRYVILYYVMLNSSEHEFRDRDRKIISVLSLAATIFERLFTRVRRVTNSERRDNKRASEKPAINCSRTSAARKSYTKLSQVCLYIHHEPYGTDSTPVHVISFVWRLETIR